MWTAKITYKFAGVSVGDNYNLYKEQSQLLWCEWSATIKKSLEIHKNPSSLEALPKL